MTRRPDQPEADVIVGVFPRRTDQTPASVREPAEVIDLVPFLLARRAHPSAPATPPADPA